MNSIPSIDPFGAEGFEVSFSVCDNSVVDVNPRISYVNKYGVINSSLKENFKVFNSENRITSPLLKVNGVFTKISVDDACNVIQKRIQQTSAAKNAVFASPEMTNELLYSVQKLARCGFKTNSVHSFKYLNVGNAFNINKNDIVPIHELFDAKQIFIFASELNSEHSALENIVQNIRVENKVPLIFITDNPNSHFAENVDEVILVADYYSFIKAVNYYILKNDLDFGIFVGSAISSGFDEYKNSLLLEDFDVLLKKSGVDVKTIKRFVGNFISVAESVFILSEKSSSLQEFLEIKNLMLLTEKQAKPASGMIFLKEFCNCQGLYDMGVIPVVGPGCRKFEGEYLDLLRSEWNVDDFPIENVDVESNLKNNFYDNIFIFGENPMKYYPQYSENIKSSEFVCVQSQFENETTAFADLVLPMNFSIEIGGSFSSSFKIAQTFSSVIDCRFEWNDYSFFSRLHELFSLQKMDNYSDVFLEFAQFFKSSCDGSKRHKFEISKS